MSISSILSDDAILRELGGRLATARVQRNLTQAALAHEAGVSKRTVERLESGAVAVQLSGLLRVCRALGLIERFDALVPEPTPSPIAQLKLQGKQRRRASATRAAPRDRKATWTWGSDS